MFTSEVHSRTDFLDHFAPAIAPHIANSNLMPSSVLSPTQSNFSDSGSYQQSPLSIYNNYNPNFHHHHYYFHSNFQDYSGYNQSQNGSIHETGWMRKYDCESQKEYFIAHTPPTPSECCDFEVPQRITQSPKPTTMKLFSDLDKIFCVDHAVSVEKNQVNNNNIGDSCDSYSFWDNENYCSVKSSPRKLSKEKLKCENVVKSEDGFLKRENKVKRHEGWYFIKDDILRTIVRFVVETIV